MSRYGNYSTTTSDRYRQPSYDRSLYNTSSLSRSKSPYRSTSSLNSHASSNNLTNVPTDNFDRLNKSLRRHDTSFMDETASSTKNDSDSRGGDYSSSSLKKKGGRKPFNVDKLNKDYSKDYGISSGGHKYGTGLSKLDDASSSASEDYDLNNNFSSLGRKDKLLVKQKPVCATSSSSESDYEPSRSNTYKTTTNLYGTSSSSPYRSTLGVASSSKPYSSSYGTYTTTTDKGDHYHVEKEDEEGDDDYSDESMSEYLHYKSYCPDSVSDSKLFVSFQ